MVEDDRSLRFGEVIKQLEPILEPHGFRLVDEYDRDASEGEVRFHVDGPLLGQFESEHPHLYEEIASSYSPQDVPCIDLIVTLSGSSPERSAFSLEGRGAEDLAHHLPSEIVEELARQKNDNPRQWLAVLSRTLVALLDPTDQLEQ
ncbi:MAG: hypothetical protein ACLFWH_07550 [Actinomycetota bacterium]